VSLPAQRESGERNVRREYLCCQTTAAVQTQPTRAAALGARTQHQPHARTAGRGALVTYVGDGLSMRSRRRRLAVPSDPLEQGDGHTASKQAGRSELKASGWTKSNPEVTRCTKVGLSRNREARKQPPEDPPQSFDGHSMG